MSKPLFDEFDGVSSKAWKQKIQVDLKGADYNDTLIWNSNEGIDVKPFYHSDEFDELPEVSGSKATIWKICQTIEVQNENEANISARNAIERGAESILFIINSENISVTDLLSNIDLITIDVHLKCNFLSEEFVSKINDITLSAVEAPNDITTIHLDIIGNLARTGDRKSVV